MVNKKKAPTITLEIDSNAVIGNSTSPLLTNCVNGVGVLTIKVNGYNADTTKYVMRYKIDLKQTATAFTKDDYSKPHPIDKVYPPPYTAKVWSHSEAYAGVKSGLQYMLGVWVEWTPGGLSQVEFQNFSLLPKCGP